MVKENNFNKSNAFDSVAQGTIEYLVIIAVVVVLSLVVVILMLNQTSTVSEADQKMTNLEWKTKEVKIMDFAVSGDGEGQIVLSSNLLNEITINSIVVDSKEISVVDGQIFFNGLAKFSLDEITNCVARGNQEYKITINYTTKEGLSKKITGVFYANCVSASEVNLGESDSTPPIVSLNSPSGELNSRSVDFNFSVSDESEITSCTLFVGEDSNIYTGINNGVNIINYTFSEDVSTIDWNVICVDANSNSNTVEESLQFSIITTGPSLTIQLNSPQNQSIFYEHELSFQFTPTSSIGEINSCTLRIGDDSNTYTGINSGIENTINYTISDDLGSFEWDINCYNDETWGISDSRNLSMGVNAIQLSTCQQLQEIDTNNETRSKNYVLTQDINCYNDTIEGGALYNSGLGFKPIGAWSTRFTGSFNGGGHTISGLNINRPSIDYIGLFGCTDSTATIQNIVLRDANIIGRNYVGSIIGTALGSVSDLTASFESIRGISYVGGIVGQVYGYNALIDFNDLDVNIASVRGSGYVGGIVGGMINFASNNSVGVLFNNLNANISDGIYSNGSYVGGLVGNATSIGSTIRDSSVDVNYIYAGTGDIQYVGGLVGNIDGNIYDSSVVFSRIDVNKSSGTYGYFGGLGGKVGFVSDCYSLGDVDATLGTYSGGSNRGYVGGLVGYSSNGISDSYSRGNFVLATKLYGNYVGGLAGYTGGPVYDSNAVFDEIKGVHSVGGLIGAHSVASVGNHLSGLFADVNVVSASYGTYSYAGGLVGVVYGYSGLSDFNDSSVRVGLVSGGNYVSGAIGAMSNFTSNNSVGVNFNNVDVEVTDKIIGVSYLGGLIGQSLSIGSTIRSSSADINYIYSVGDSQFVGGLVGQTDGNIYDSSIVFGEIDVNKSSGSWGYFGGLGGKVGFVSNCFSIGDSIDATLGAYSGGSNYSGVGGLVGYSSKGISNSYSRGNFILATKSNGKNVGGLAGGTEGPVYDSNAIFDEIKGYSSVGGLIGSHSVAVAGSHLRGLFADVNVVSASYGTYSYAGGLVGVIYGYSGLSDFNDSSVRVGLVSGGNYVSGAIGAMSNFTSNNSVGVNFNNVDVEVTDKIIGVSYLGGLIGQSLSIGSTIRSSSADINYIYSVGDSQFVGGLVGQTDGNIYDSSIVFGEIDVNKSSGSWGYFGGLGGKVGFVSNCFSIGDSIDATLGAYSGGSNYSGVGGLVGYSSKGISNSYSRGNFILATKSNGKNVGGLAGGTEGPVYDSNAIFDEIKGYSSVGGLIGSHSVAVAGSHLRGLFADVNVVSASYGTYSYAGGLVGVIYGYSGLSDFNDSSVSVGRVSGGNYVGGLVGGLSNFVSNNSVGVLFNNLDANVYDKISATGSYVGGLIGQNFSMGSTIRDSSADVNYILVIGNPQFIGGLVGSTDGNIYNSHSITQIDVSKSGSSDVYLGGLAGKASSINECYSDANINDSNGVYSGARIGGLVGSLNNDIKNSYSTGYSLSATKSSGHYVGGLVGFINSTSTIENSYSTIENILKGTNSYSGGLVGYESASTLINNSFSTSTITSTGGSYNGNLVGYSTCAPACITNSYYLSGEEVMLYSASPSSVSSSGVDYFKGNLTNEPMVNWSTLIWVSEANNYPQLIN